ncbi:hypothetical protein HDU76_004807 [Blyttiomyces sp. JEL0837]|nr:hypothetical protein HDU76_004807 [Blyttiomyces sp. JEL0837]
MVCDTSFRDELCIYNTLSTDSTAFEPLIRPNATNIGESTFLNTTQPMETSTLTFTGGGSLQVPVPIVYKMNTCCLADLIPACLVALSSQSSSSSTSSTTSITQSDNRLLNSSNAGLKPRWPGGTYFIAIWKELTVNGCISSSSVLEGERYLFLSKSPSVLGTSGSVSSCKSSSSTTCVVVVNQTCAGTDRRILPLFADLQIVSPVQSEQGHHELHHHNHPALAVEAHGDAGVSNCSCLDCCESVMEEEENLERDEVEKHDRDSMMMVCDQLDTNTIVQTSHSIDVSLLYQKTPGLYHLSPIQHINSYTPESLPNSSDSFVIWMPDPTPPISSNDIPSPNRSYYWPPRYHMPPCPCMIAEIKSTLHDELTQTINRRRQLELNFTARDTFIDPSHSGSNHQNYNVSQWIHHVEHARINAALLHADDNDDDDDDDCSCCSCESDVTDTDDELIETSNRDIEINNGLLHVASRSDNSVFTTASTTYTISNIPSGRDRADSGVSVSVLKGTMNR